LENEERNDDEVDGGCVDSSIDLRRMVSEVDVVAVNVVLQQHVQKTCSVRRRTTSDVSP